MPGWPRSKSTSDAGCRRSIAARSITVAAESVGGPLSLGYLFIIVAMINLLY